MSIGSTRLVYTYPEVYLHFQLAVVLALLTTCASFQAARSRSPMSLRCWSSPEGLEKAPDAK